MSISTAIKIGLVKSDITQQELASSIGARRETVSTWCNGHYSPNYKMVELMAEIFGVSVSEFIKWGE